ncbi:Ankyrin [Ectocarpus siliculosus]|uniref:Ankyrin n=1 Tax=Ectocarpus siliculosus TaxID=2880 RepID=D7FLD3_ECTSI|nr:Ankyrin [Ectocarpus siliculosus]|eukprot:CBJ29701.1 Ankyrin [Ectocarpus siliculosus]
MALKLNSDAVRHAVKDGDVDAVREYLESGVEANLANPNTGRTLLHIACRQGYSAIASLLLSNGANPGATTLRQLTPLHLACHQGHLKVARLVLEAWAPVDDRDETGATPLHLSAQQGHTDVVRLLLQCGADKDAMDQSGWTPVFFASWNGHAEVARMLLQAGANARVSDLRDNITALHLACCWGQLEVAKVLLEYGADSSAKDCNGSFPDHVIGAGSPDSVDPACAHELSEVVVGHRRRIKGASSSLECVVDSLRSKVSHLEDQLERAERERLEVMAYSSDESRATFSAAVKPECPVCQVEVKEAVLDPCRHLAACASCANSLQSCPLCNCPVRGYRLLESRQVYERVSALEDESAGMRAQLKRFSRRVRDLVAENADLKLDVRRTRAEILVVTAERRGLEERFLLRTPSPAPTPPVVESGSIAAGSSVASFEGGGTEKPRGRFTLTSENSTGTSGACDDGIHRMQGPGVVFSGGGSSAASLDEPELAVLDRPRPADGSYVSGRPASGEGKGQTAGSSKSSCSELIAEGANSSGNGDPSKTTTTVESGARVDASEGGDGQDAERCFFPDRTVGDGDATPTPREATCGTDNRKYERQEELHACTLGTLAELKDGAGGGGKISTALGTVQAASGSAADDPLDLETACLNETTADSHLDLETVRVNKSVADNHLDHETVRLKESDCAAFSRSVRPTRACSVSVKIVGGACTDCSDTTAETTHPANLPGALLLAGDVVEEETNSRSSPMNVSNSGNQVVERDTNSVSDDGDWSISTNICGDKSGAWPSSSFILAQSQR